MSQPPVDYAHLPGEEQNPLMESTAHVDWGLVLLNAARHTLIGTNDLVTGNVALAVGDGGPHTAPDVMVVPGARGQTFGRYEPGPDGPVPSVCVEILSPSNTRRQIQERCRRLLTIGVGEVYVLDPVRETVVEVSMRDDELHERSAIGVPSIGLGLTFVSSDGRLAICCPAGRVVRPGDDPFGWLADEAARADAAESRADAAEERNRAMDERNRAAEERIRLLEAELAERRASNPPAAD
ncbi:MAG: Uma2 family endonuclease [Acidimicrobiia bacterium]